MCNIVIYLSVCLSVCMLQPWAQLSTHVPHTYTYMNACNVCTKTNSVTLTLHCNCNWRLCMWSMLCYAHTTTLTCFLQFKRVKYCPMFFLILLTHEGSHREVYRDFQPSLTSSASGAKGCSDHRFCAPPAYTARLPTLHQHRANNQCRTLIKSCRP